MILPGRGEPRAWLDAHVNLETGVGAPRTRDRGAPTLERISTLLEYLGSPQFEFPAIHLTGTNGKTTTTRMITQLLACANYTAGAYTSPHLERVNERIVRVSNPSSVAVTFKCILPRSRVVRALPSCRSRSVSAVIVPIR